MKREYKKQESKWLNNLSVVFLLLVLVVIYVVKALAFPIAWILCKLISYPFDSKEYWDSGNMWK